MSVEPYFVIDRAEAKVAAADWKEAIRQVGKLHEAAGTATSEYAEAMIAGVEKFGPYIVLTPNVAVPHAQTAAGVKRTGVVVATLETPVNFGSPANDPVDILISFAAFDKAEHMKTIQSLPKLLGDQELLTQARNATTSEELAKLFILR